MDTNGELAAAWNILSQVSEYTKNHTHLPWEAEHNLAWFSEFTKKFWGKRTSFQGANFAFKLMVKLYVILNT